MKQASRIQLHVHRICIGDMFDIMLTSLLVLGVLCSRIICMDIYARCADDMEFYADGVSKGTHNDKTITTSYNLPDTTEVFAIKCTVDPSQSTRGGIFASFDIETEGDYQTDNTWRCSNILVPNWFQKSFDDSDWLYAATSGRNNETANDLTKDDTLKPHVQWIWTDFFDTSYGDKTVYCRGSHKISQTQDSFSRRFVVGFMENTINTSKRKDIKLVFMTYYPTEVTILISTVTLLSSDPVYIQTSVSVKAGEVQTVVLPQNLRHYDTDTKDYGILVVASLPVKVIGINQEASSTDANLMLPFTSLGNSTTSNVYYTVNWDSSDARVVLIAGYEDTDITVRSPVQFTYNSASQSANTDIFIDLSLRYQSVQLTAGSGFTGTKITSNKPLVVLSGNRKTSISNGLGGSTSDHLVEQLLPVRNWGKLFYLTPMPYSTDPTKGRMGQNLEKYKYVASEDGTLVTIKNYYSNGTQFESTVTFNLSAGASHDISHTRGTYAVVTSNNAIQVAQFATSKTQHSSAPGNCMGDPWLQIIPPVQLFSRDISVLTPELNQQSSCPQQHFVTIIIKEKEKDCVTINNVLVDWSDGVNISDTGYIYVTINIPFHLTKGVRIQHCNTWVSFGVYFYGYGKADSYGLMSQIRMFPINEPCYNTTSELGDGIDNNCNGEIDEEDCGNVTDPSRDCALPPPVDGNWAEWLNRGGCQCTSRSSSIGTQVRMRTCSNPIPKYYGWPCNATIDDGYRQDNCTCVHGSWSSWVPVSNNCSCPSGIFSGTQQFNRACNNPPPSNGGWDCDNSTWGTIKEENCNCPRDGVWTNWSLYGSCSASCGPGIKTRSRTCTDPSPLYGGADCIGNASESTSCEIVKCPIHGGWTNWTTSGGCVCPNGSSDGSQQYDRSCTEPTPQHNGDYCDTSLYNTTKDENCNCPIDGAWSTWTNYDICTEACGPGNKTRTRTCTNPPPENGGTNCTGDDSETTSCEIKQCPIHGGWTNWTTSGGCVCPSGSSDGSQQYDRSCTEPTPQHNGDYCDTSLYNTTKDENCNCPIDGGWSTWTNYDTCTEACGPGNKTRTRTCTNPPPEYGGANCTGDDSETTSCEIKQCPIHGGWTNWTATGGCVCPNGSTNGKQQYDRTCTDPIPQYGGNYCNNTLHNTTKEEDCQCSLDGTWSAWSAYSACSNTCGPGSQSRSRSCSQPVLGGNNCTGPSSQTRGCNVVNCPIHGDWTSWTLSGGCVCPNNSSTGKQQYTRNCTNPSPQYNGDYCNDTQYNTTKEETCNCSPINGQWSAWSAYSACSTTCGPGTQSGSRTCTNPAPQYGGNSCPGSSTQTQQCQVINCPVHGGWTNWVKEGGCVCLNGSTDGIQQYNRSCTSPAPQHSGDNCNISTHNTTKEESCHCPIDGGWTAWSAYDNCSTPCGPGTKTRSRNCTEPAPVYGGATCPGSDIDSASCEIKKCAIDGGWTAWSNFSECVCSVINSTYGQAVAIRNCSNPEPQYGGQPCAVSGPIEAKYNICECATAGSVSGTANQKKGPSTAAIVAGTVSSLVIIAAIIAGVILAKIYCGKKSTTKVESIDEEGNQGIGNTSNAGNEEPVHQMAVADI